MQKKFYLLTMTLLPTLPLVAASCKTTILNNVKLNSSQIENIRKKFRFELTNAGINKYNDGSGNGKEEIKKLLFDKQEQYKLNIQKIKFDEELRKYVIIDFMDVNNLPLGHELKLRIVTDRELPVIRWTVSCAQFGIENPNGVAEEVLLEVS